MYRCEADNEDELSFDQGEIIIVLKEEEEEWWVSYRGGDGHIIGWGLYGITIWNKWRGERG